MFLLRIVDELCQRKSTTAIPVGQMKVVRTGAGWRVEDAADPWDLGGRLECSSAREAVLGPVADSIVGSMVKIRGLAEWVIDVAVRSMPNWIDGQTHGEMRPQHTCQMDCPTAGQFTYLYVVRGVVKCMTKCVTEGIGDMRTLASSRDPQPVRHHPPEALFLLHSRGARVRNESAMLPFEISEIADAVSLVRRQCSAVSNSTFLLAVLEDML